MKASQRALFLLVASALPLAARGQEIPAGSLLLEWEHIYGRRGVPCFETVYSVAPAWGGGFILAGYRAEELFIPTRIYLVRVDADGNELFSREIDHSDGDGAAYVKQSRNGGFILLGGTDAPPACNPISTVCHTPLGERNPDILLVETDGFGRVEWMRTYGGSDRDFGLGLVETEEGDFIITGATHTENQWDIYVFRTDAMGRRRIWERRFGGPWDDVPARIIEDDNGDYVVAGTYKDVPGPGPQTFSDAYLIKLDAGGNVIWEKRYRSPGKFRPVRDVAPAGDGSVIMIASERTQKGTEIYAARIDPRGELIWERTYGQGVPRRISRAQGGFVIQSNTSNSSCGEEKISLLKIDGGGEPLWHSCYPGPRFGHALLALGDGSYLIAGETSGRGSESGDAFLGKVRSGLFMRGDLDGDRALTVTDAVLLLRGLFRNGEIECLDAGDADDDGRLNVTDAVVMLLHLFRGGPAPPPPEAGAGCGSDPTADALDCKAHPRCR